MDKGYFRLGTYEAIDFLGINFEEDKRGRFTGIYKDHLNRALDLMLTVLVNYTFVNKNYNEELDHGFYNDSTRQYSGCIGMLQRKEIDMIFPMVIPTNILSEGFAMTYAMEEGQLTIGTLTKSFKYKKIELIHNLNALDLTSWTLLISAFLITFFLINFLRYILNSSRPNIKRKKIFYILFKKLFRTPIDYNHRTHLKITILLITILIIRQISTVIFSCLSSNYIVIDKSNLVTSLKDLLDESTIVLTTALDSTTEFLNRTPTFRTYYDRLIKKLNKCGIYCYLETLNRKNYQALSNFANSRLSLISTKQIMTVMATTLCFLLHRNSLGSDDTNEILFYKIPVQDTQQTYGWAINEDIKKSKLDEINLYTIKLMQNQVLDVLYKEMIEQYAPIVARIGPMFDQQDKIDSNLDINHFVLNFESFNSAIYTFLVVNLLVVSVFVFSIIRKSYSKSSKISLNT